MMSCARSDSPWSQSFALMILVGLVAASSVQAQVAVTSRTLVERTASPGETYRDVIALRNGSDRTQVVQLSLADYRFQASGITHFDAPGSNPRSSTPWITLGQREVSLPPHGEAAVEYTVSVPSELADIGGSYWSVVLVEPAPRNDAGGPRRDSFAIVPQVRYAVQVATHIGETGNSTLAFGEPRIDAESLTFDITHVGTRACRPIVRVELYDAEGALVHASTAQRGLVYPTTSIRQVFALPPISPGNYKALVLIDTGADTVQGSQFQIHVR